MGILDKLVEKKDLMIYIDNKIEVLRDKKAKLPDEIDEPQKREPAIRQVEGRIKELEHLKSLLSEDYLKESADKHWEMAQSINSEKGTKGGNE